MHRLLLLGVALTACNAGELSGSGPTIEAGLEVGLEASHEAGLARDGGVDLGHAIDQTADRLALEAQVPTCAPGRVDCDGKPGNGCESQLATDARNCGKCGRACRNAACQAGRCQVKVLIYAGSDAGSNGVKNTRTSLDAANASGYVPGVQFSHATTAVVSSAKLSGVNVLVMPGGDSGWSYLNNASIGGSAIKQFVQAGGGYVGTCAGAYAGSAETVGYKQYTGWGVAPNTKTIAFSYEGNLTVQLTAFGTKLLGASGVMTLHHWNGPAMVKDPASGPAQSLAAYDSTTHKGKVAIIADSCGAGRTVLSGPHPELDPQHPEIVSRLVGWASGSFNP